MIFLILSTITMAFITGVKLGQLIQMKRQQKVLKGILLQMVDANIKAFDRAILEYKNTEDFWLDKHAMARNTN